MENRCAYAQEEKIVMRRNDMPSTIPEMHPERRAAVQKKHAVRYQMRRNENRLVRLIRNLFRPAGAAA